MCDTLRAVRRAQSCRVCLCPWANLPLSSSGAEHPPAPEHHHLHSDRPVPAAGAGGRGCHQNWQEIGGVLAPSRHVAAQDASRLFPACGEDAAPHASPDAELRAPLQRHWPTGPLRTLCSGLKQVWVLPTAIPPLPSGNPDKVLSCWRPARPMVPVQGVDGTEGAGPAPVSYKRHKGSFPVLSSDLEILAPVTPGYSDGSE